MLLYCCWHCSNLSKMLTTQLATSSSHPRCIDALHPAPASWFIKGELWLQYTTSSLTLTARSLRNGMVRCGACLRCLWPGWPDARWSGPCIGAVPLGAHLCWSAQICVSLPPPLWPGCPGCLPDVWQHTLQVGAIRLHGEGSQAAQRSVLMEGQKTI